MSERWLRKITSDRHWSIRTISTPNITKFISLTLIQHLYKSCELDGLWIFRAKVEKMVSMLYLGRMMCIDCCTTVFDVSRCFCFTSKYLFLLVDLLVDIYPLWLRYSFTNDIWHSKWVVRGRCEYGDRLISSMLSIFFFSFGFNWLL